MPGVVFLKERFEVHVALGERTQATIATCELQFYEGNENALNPFHVERLIGDTYCAIHSSKIIVLVIPAEL